VKHLDRQAYPQSFSGMILSPVNDRISEIAEILAAGLTRLEARKSSRKSTEIGESSLHFAPDQSGDAPPCPAEISP
jgi:hypothetical protein